MILVKLQGGLGNQMFQYAAGRNVSASEPLYLDIGFYNHQHGVTPRKYSLSSFPNLNAKIYKSETNGYPFVLYTEPPQYKSITTRANTNMYLDGYFQTEKYFKSIDKELQEEFAPDKETVAGLQNIYPELNNSCVSLHVRRTDYVNMAHVHTVQAIDYYYDALKSIGKFDQLYIFSDDIHWCKENLKTPKTTYVEGNSDIEDMWMMNMCKKHIIANSSFSWWGAWLAKSEKVIAPKNWFGPSGPKDWNDIYCDGWNVL